MRAAGGVGQPSVATIANLRDHQPDPRVLHLRAIEKLEVVDRGHDRRVSMLPRAHLELVHHLLHAEADEGCCRVSLRQIVTGLALPGPLPASPW